jgi:hypothetical protein
MDSREGVQQPSMTRRRVSRRAILRLGLAAIAAVPLATACGQQPPAPPAAPAATQPPAATTSAVAPAASQAPAAPTQAVAAPAAAKPAAEAKAAAPPVAKAGASLIGKLEGPSLVTDPAQFPKSFK